MPDQLDSDRRRVLGTSALTLAGATLGVAPEQGAVRPHQPGQDAFRSVLPEDVDWKPFAAFPPSVRLAVLVGQPSEAVHWRKGLFVKGDPCT